MALIHNAPATLYAPERAEEIVRDLMVASEPDFEDDDWTFTAVHDPKGTGLSFVEIRDEDGELVGRL